MLFDNLFAEPVFVLTSDQDWAPVWAAQTLLAHIEKHAVPCHFFRTSRCPALDSAMEKSSGSLTQGWHPNFLPGSSHGSTPAEVVEFLKRTFPGVNTVRSHTFAEGTYSWRELASAGIIADSQTVTLYQAELQPLLHWTGIVRFPVYFEDDIFFEQDPDRLDLGSFMSTLFTPGLKILNFHATFVGLNIPSDAYYLKVKDRVFNTLEQPDGVRFAGRGSADVFDELVGTIKQRGYSFAGFPQLVTQVRQFIDSHPDRFPDLVRKKVHSL